MKHTNPNTRHDFVILFDVTNGNPNGDPDAGNMPRMDPETNLGMVTDVAIKRKVRDFVSMSQGNVDGKRIFIQSEVALNTLIEQGRVKSGVPKSNSKKDADAARAQMCKDYYDVRMFGAVMSTGENAGQVRGPMQLTFARSIGPIMPLDLSITRQAAATEKDFEAKGGKTMGRKPLIPYGLYMAKGFYNPFLGKQTGVSEDDLSLFWQALQKCFEFDRSASRGEMACRGIHIFTHDTELGNAPSHKLFDLVKVAKKPGVQSPRAFSDYEISLGSPPSGVSATTLE